MSATPAKPATDEMPATPTKRAKDEMLAAPTKECNVRGPRAGEADSLPNAFVVRKEGDLADAGKGSGQAIAATPTKPPAQSVTEMRGNALHALERENARNSGNANERCSRGNGDEAHERRDARNSGNARERCSRHNGDEGHAGRDACSGENTRDSATGFGARNLGGAGRCRGCCCGTGHKSRPITRRCTRNEYGAIRE